MHFERRCCYITAKKKATFMATQLITTSWERYKLRFLTRVTGLRSTSSLGIMEQGENISVGSFGRLGLN
jgi:hypothetical protein